MEPQLHLERVEDDEMLPSKKSEESSDTDDNSKTSSSDSPKTVPASGKRDFSLRTQKNVIPKLITPAFIRQFVGEKESSVLELWQKLTLDIEREKHLRSHGGTIVNDLWQSEKKLADKRFKRTYKTVVKLGILLKNDVFTPEDKKHLERLSHNLEMFAEMTVKTYRKKVSYDYEMISGVVHNIGNEANLLLSPHMTPKNLNKLKDVVQYFESRSFIDSAFDTNMPYSATMKNIVDLLADIMCLY